MNKVIKIFTVTLVLVAACQKPELPDNNTEQENSGPDLNEEQVLLKTLLADRDTRWIVDELEIPEVSGGWNLISNDKELAFLLEFGCTEGGKYRLENDIDIASSELKDKFTSEIGIEKFVNFEFDGNEKRISGLILPIAAGVFSDVSGTSKVYDLTLESCIVGSVANVSNLLGTGILFGSANGTLEVSNVAVYNSSVMAPCKVGGMIGTFVDSTASFDGCSVNQTSVTATYLKGISGWCGGFIGYIGRTNEKSRDKVVSVEFTNCKVDGGVVSGHMEADTRYSGKFLGTVNGYDYRECVTLVGCTATPEFSLADAVSYTEDDMIGGDKYGMAAVSVDGKAPAVWDGITTKEPGRSTAAYDGVDGAYLVLDAAELAWFQGKTVTDNILIRRDINLGGQLFAPIHMAQYIDGQKANGENACISGLKVVRTNCGKEDGGAFIRQASGTTVHKNITFRKADIRATHDESADHGNAYCATLCGNMTGTYTMENVHAYDGKLYGVNKMGGLLGRVYATATIENCSVSGYYIENYQVDKPEDFGNELIPVIFYPQGEVGGMIGFIQGDATVSNCHVYNTEINAFGQNDKNMIFMVVPGRHVGTVIGDIRVGNSNTAFNIVINDTSSDTETENLTKQHRLDQHSGATFVGKCYYAQTSDQKGTVTVDGKSVTIN